MAQMFSVNMLEKKQARCSTDTKMRHRVVEENSEETGQNIGRRH
jgi:hypothetical protein